MCIYIREVIITYIYDSSQQFSNNTKNIYNLQGETREEVVYKLADEMLEKMPR